MIASSLQTLVANPSASYGTRLARSEEQRQVPADIQPKGTAIQQQPQRSKLLLMQSQLEGANRHAAMCAGMDTDTCADVTVDRCTDMCAQYADITVDMCRDMCMNICTDMCPERMERIQAKLSALISAK